MSKKRKTGRKFNNSPRKKSSLTVEGVLSCIPSGYGGFVITENDDKDIYVDAEYFGGANHGDRVTVSVFKTSQGKKRREGRITKVIERTITSLTATIVADFGGALSAKADNPRYFPPIYISYGDTLGATVGDRVAVELVNFDYMGDPVGMVIENLGSSDLVKSRLDGILYSHSVKSQFDDAVLKEAEKISDRIPETEIAKRLDLRKEKIITIDGKDAKDFDDAISIRKLPGGGYRLGVHIADVSFYVKSGSEIDKEAFERGTSIYLPDRVIPMLPERLSNGVCSLRPNENRLTLSCIIDITASGDVKSYKIEKSVIRSLHRMTYDDVQKILDGDGLLRSKYSDILTQLSHMQDLSDILTKKRKKRGSIDFDIPETRIILDNDCKVSDIVAVNRLKSHMIIEEFMLIANETVAKHASERNIPIIYRAHNAPSLEKLKALSIFLKNFGLYLPDDLEAITPKTLQKLLESIDGETYQQIVAKNMLRAMMKAEYKSQNTGHFGLAADFYCHFTSPIRRYPDLIVHRALSGDEVINTKQISTHSSETERNAEECERDSLTLLKVMYIKEHIGKQFPAVITSLSEYGIYAELENTIEGMIRLETLRGDYYYYDEKYASVFGKRTKRAFKIGDRIEIVVTGANPDLLRIDFELKKESIGNAV